MTYVQADSAGVQTPGHDCANCGNPGHEHKKKRVSHDDGTYSNDYQCPDEGDANRGDADGS